MQIGGTKPPLKSGRLGRHPEAGAGQHQLPGESWREKRAKACKWGGSDCTERACSLLTGSTCVWTPTPSSESKSQRRQEAFIRTLLPSLQRMSTDMNTFSISLSTLQGWDSSQHRVRSGFTKFQLGPHRSLGSFWRANTTQDPSSCAQPRSLFSGLRWDSGASIYFCMRGIIKLY